MSVRNLSRTENHVALSRAHDAGLFELRWLSTSLPSQSHSDRDETFVISPADGSTALTASSRPPIPISRISVCDARPLANTIECRERTEFEVRQGFVRRAPHRHVRTRRRSAVSLCVHAVHSECVSLYSRMTCGEVYRPTLRQPAAATGSHSSIATLDPLPFVPANVKNESGRAIEVEPFEDPRDSVETEFDLLRGADGFQPRTSQVRQRRYMRPVFNAGFSGGDGAGSFFELGEQLRELVTHFPAIDDHVDGAVIEKEFAALESFGQLLAYGLLDDARPREADQSAFGSATLMSPSIARLADTPPVVGSVRTETKGHALAAPSSRQRSGRLGHLQQREQGFLHTRAAAGRRTRSSACWFSSRMPVPRRVQNAHPTTDPMEPPMKPKFESAGNEQAGRGAYRSPIRARPFRRYFFCACTIRSRYRLLSRNLSGSCGSRFLAEISCMRIRVERKTSSRWRAPIRMW